MENTVWNPSVNPSYLSPNYQRKKRNYVNNADLYAAIVEYHKAKNDNLPLNRKTYDYIGECIMLIAKKIANKYNFSGYSYIDEMIDDGIENCFHRDTKFLTLERGVVSLGEAAGEQLTVKTIDGQWRKATVKSYGVQPLYEIGFGSKNTPIDYIHHKIIATSSHRWFVDARLNNRKMYERSYRQIVTDLRVGDVLSSIETPVSRDPEAVIHGLIFGDGSGHKGTVYGDPAVVLQGTKYSFLRVCKQDSSRDEIMKIMEDAGYKPQYRPHAKGDPIYWLGKKYFIKDVPFTTDPEYISGFIYGWWLADGYKTIHENRIVISSSNETAVEWLKEHAAYAGYVVISVRKKDRSQEDGSFINGKPLFVVTMAPPGTYHPVVRYKKYVGDDEVFCLEEPETSSFVLANGFVTGNCIVGLNSFDPAKTNSIFSYFTTIIHYAFIRRIEKEKRIQYVKIKNMMNTFTFAELFDEHLVNREVYENNLEYVYNYEKRLEEKKKKAAKPQGLDPYMEIENEP